MDSTLVHGILTPLPWTPMARVLEQLISDLSEECWAAGWMVGADLDVWALLRGESRSKVWYADEDEIAKIRAVLEASARWVAWPKEWKEAAPVALNEWHRYYTAAKADFLRRYPDCPHDSASGVDQAGFGPDKVWRCDSCGWLHRVVPDPIRPGISLEIAAADTGPLPPTTERTP